jgi:hypothetical protein
MVNRENLPDTFEFPRVLRSYQMPDRLKITDRSLFPVQAFFNAVSDSSFLQVMRSLIAGTGYSINDAHVRFPSDLDPDEATFEGVRFSIYEDTVTLSLRELKSYIRHLTTDFAREHPEEKEATTHILNRL